MGFCNILSWHSGLLWLHAAFPLDSLPYIVLIVDIVLIQVASALSDPYLSFAAALNGLAGPLHGLANQVNVSI